MSLFGYIREHKKPNAYARPYKGTVLINVDPLFLGGIKCTVPGKFEDSDHSKLPWIYPQGVSIGNGSGGGSRDVPEVGRVVQVTFPYDSIYFPVYTSFWSDPTTQDHRFAKDTGSTYGLGDTTGFQVVVDKINKSFTFSHPSGMDITMDTAGVDFLAENNLKLGLKESPSYLLFNKLDGSVNISSNEAVNIVTPEYKVTAGKDSSVYQQKDVTVKGSDISSIGGNVGRSVGGSYNLSITGHHNMAVAGKSSTVIADSLDVVVGTSKTEQILTGDSTETILLGNKTITTLVGDVELSAGGGLVSQSLSATGSYSMQTPTGSMSITSAGTMELKASTLMTLMDGGSPFLLGDQWAQLVPSHTHPTPAGESGPSQQLIQGAKDVLSKQIMGS